MKIVIFGGSFDPWTSAHSEITQRLSLNYDLVIVIPTAIHYYKANNRMFSFDERLKMAKENTANLSNVELSSIEKNAGKDWRFVHTLKKIKEQKGSQHEYYVAIGSDSLQNFTTWYEWQEILNNSSLVVFNRPGYTTNFPEIPFEYLPMENPISSTQIRKELLKQ